MIDLPRNTAATTPSRTQTWLASELGFPDRHPSIASGTPHTRISHLPDSQTSRRRAPVATTPGRAVNMINRWGTAVGWAETSVADPACPAPEVLSFMPAVWRDGKGHGLPPYPGDPDGLASAINDHGQIVGSSGTCTTFQPTLVNLRGVHPIMWEDGKPIDLGNLGGPHRRGWRKYCLEFEQSRSGRRSLRPSAHSPATSTVLPPASTTLATSSVSLSIKTSTAARFFATTAK